MYTARLTPLQVKDAIIEWALRNGLIDCNDHVSFRDVTVKENGSAKIEAPTGTRNARGGK